MSYPITLINPNQNIGDSLNIINQNYNSLSNWIIDLQGVNDLKWQPVYDFYIKYADRMSETLTLIKTLSTKWDDYQTTVQTNSAKWLQPFTIFYPNVLAHPFIDSYSDKIKTWLQTSFPIRNDDGSLNYVEGQQFIVNCHTYYVQPKINIINQELKDQTTCVTGNATVYVYCSDIWANNYVHCSNGGQSCGYSRSCSNSAQSECYYLSPYLKSLTDPTPIGTVNTRAITGIGRIRATVDARFTDRFENSFIKSLRFKVVDCEWVFDKFIT